MATTVRQATSIDSDFSVGAVEKVGSETGWVEHSETH
jgi:hypothetical protein